MNPFWLIKYRLMKNNCYQPGMDIGEALQYATLLAEDMAMAEAIAEAKRGS